ncbi:MAG: hypothetical protein ACT4QD_09975 [Acidobacteriota bacterium]
MAKRPPLSLVVHKNASASSSEVDRLYQLPLEEFTAARNELAKRGGRTDPAIRGLEKPTVAAWAVNHLYWHDRLVYDRLVTAAERVRLAHHARLAGKDSALGDAERAHGEALREAMDAVRARLRASGEAASPATLEAVGQTLRALPTDAAAGRLARPLKPRAFDALAGVALRPLSPKAPPPVGSPPGSSRSSKAEIAEHARHVTARRRRAHQLWRTATAAVTKARAALASAERTLARREQDAAAARKAADRARAALADAVAAQERAALDARE